MYDKLTDIQLKEAIELLIKEKVISKELSETMLSANVLTNPFGQPSVFLQEMLALIGKEFLVVDTHYELGTYEGKYY